MKHFLLIISFFMLTASGFSQGLYLSYDAFCKKLEEKTISDLGKLISIQDEVDRYEAVFTDPSGRMLMLKLSKGEVFQAFERTGERYSLEGFEAIFVGNKLMSMLLIYLPEPDATVVLSSNVSMQKSLLEKLALDSGITALKPDATDWPAVIPLSQRLDGRVLRIVTKPSTTEGYRFEVVVDFWCDENLIASIERLKTSFTDRNDFIEMDDMLLISKGESIGQVTYCSSASSKMTFGYYIR